jgi:hypothetical protein
MTFPNSSASGSKLLTEGKPAVMQISSKLNYTLIRRILDYMTS